MDVSSFAIGLLVLLLVCLHLLQCVDGAPQSFQPQSDLRVCVGDPVTFTCTVVDDPPLSEVTVWRASGGVVCTSALAHAGSLTGTCSEASSSTEFMVNGAVQGMDCVEIEFTAAMATVDMDDTLIECHNGSALNPSTLVGSSRLIVEGDPPSTPTDVVVILDISDPQRAFVVQWSGATVGSLATIGGYNVIISGSDDGCGERGVPQFTAGLEYSCPMPSVGGMYTFSVSAVCGTLEGTAAEATVTLRVPEAPTCTACPVYDQSTGELLRIESTCTTVPAVTIANGVDGSPDAYIFSYNGVLQPPVPSGRCTGGTCRDVFNSTDPTVSQYTVSVTARNVVGEGPSATRVINATNDLMEVEVGVGTRTVQCRFLGGFTGTAECQIEYSTREDLSGSVVNTGSSASGDIVTLILTAPLERGTTYYYRVTATAEDVCVRAEGCFQTDCLASKLGVVDTSLDQNCEGFVGSVQMPAGQACFTGTVPGSIAVYACTSTCDSQYRLEGVRTRVCQSDGTWSGAMPQCQSQCLSRGAVIGITSALTFLVAFTAGVLVAFVIGCCYIRRQILKGRYSPSDTKQPTLIQASTHVQEGGIELKENISYGPVPSQPPALQQRGPMYEEVVQTGNIEVKANVAYGPVGH